MLTKEKTYSSKKKKKEIRNCFRRMQKSESNSNSFEHKWDHYTNSEFKGLSERLPLALIFNNSNKKSRLDTFCYFQILLDFPFEDFYIHIYGSVLSSKDLKSTYKGFLILLMIS